MKIAIKEAKWTYHEIAAKQYFQKEQLVDIVEKIDMESLLDSVISWEADYWLIEIENTITWTMYHYLNLLNTKNISIIWETYLKVEQNLIALPWSKLEDIKAVCWKPTGIEQARRFFDNYPKINLIECENLSIIWRDIKEKNLKSVWLIWWKLTAKMYGFNILADKIEGERKNYTRFLIVQEKSKVQNKEFNKASLHILLPHQVGSLMKILWIVAAYWITLTKIESVPIPSEPFNYSFYIDISFDYPQRYHGMLTAIKPLLKELDILWEYLAYNKPIWNI